MSRPFLVASLDILARSVVYRNCYFSHYTKRTTQLVSSRNVKKIRILNLCCFKEKYFKRSSPLICYELTIMTPLIGVFRTHFELKRTLKTFNFRIGKPYFFSIYLLENLMSSLV